MYYEIYDKEEDRVFVICPGYESARKMLEAIDDPNCVIRPIEKSKHPLFNNPNHKSRS